MKTFKDLLTQNGFKPVDQLKVAGYVIPYVHEFRKQSGTTFQYVSLVTYSTDFVGKTAKEMLELEGEVVEAVYELFMAEKNTRRPKGLQKQTEMVKKGFDFVQAALPRSLTDLNAYVTRTDSQLKDLAEQLYVGLVLLEKQKK
jgi:hypothetical protein